jgi:predicted nucleic acid-binding protein
MDTWVWIVIAVAIVVVLAALLWGVVNSRRRKELQEGFGPEYDRTVSEAPSRREAESELLERRERHDEFDIRPLTPDARERYAQEWEATQARFVDSPESAIRDADDLIQSVMRERGYPVEDFDQRAADLSVDHPDVVENYRKGHDLARRTVRGEGDTESLRQALVHYRALFEELLVTEQAEDRAELRQ